MEASASGTVDLRFAGLLAATDYDCTVASTRPTGGDPFQIPLRTPDPPVYFPEADATFNGAYEITGAYTVMNIRPECSSDDPIDHIVVLDPDGNNRWLYALPRGMNIGIEVASDGYNRFLWGGGDDSAGAPTVVDVFDGEQWSLSYPGSVDVTYHHDVNRIDDGRILSVEQTDAPGWAAFQLRLVDESGATSWFWDVQDAVADGWLPAGSPDSTDPHHLNWADVVDTDQGLVAYGSLCYAFFTVAIDVATSEPLWKFGPGGDFALQDTNGNELPVEEFPQCQHGLQMDGTHLMVYDNGFDRGNTRVVEYTLDAVAKTATQTWVWEEEEGFSEIYHGGTDWLTPDHERVLVAEGNNDCGVYSQRHSQVVEVDRTVGTEVVHRLVLKDVGDWLYRGHRVEGCDVFANTKYCATLADRLDELRPVLGL